MMKTKIKIGLACVVIVAALVWAFTSVWPVRYSGSSIMFPVGSGHALVSNTGQEAIPIEMRTEGRATSFRIASAELGLAESATRQGSGRDAYYSLSFDLPPGQARIDITRGSNVQLISRADTRIEAVVTTMAANTIRWILVLSGIVVLWALYYISGLLEHRWIGALRRRLSRSELQSEASTT